MCARVEPTARHQVSSNSQAPYFFEAQTFTEPGTNRLGRLPGQQAPSILFPTSPELGVSCHTQIFIVLGIQTQSLLFVWQALERLNHFPAPKRKF